MTLSSPAPDLEALRHLERAIELALRGRFRTSPNPRVGAVVVRDGEVVGEGWHREVGGPHAEVEALAQAGDRARGATLFVTLEPCSHFGRTPPCVDAVIAAAKEVGKLVASRAVAAGVKDVVFDRGGFIFHGRVKALADAAREGGLKF